MIGWKNGDKCTHEDFGMCYFIGAVAYDDDYDCVVESYMGNPYYAMYSALSKPETPEQKASREREEMAEKIYSIHTECAYGKHAPSWCDVIDAAKSIYRAMVDAGVIVK